MTTPKTTAELEHAWPRTIIMLSGADSEVENTLRTGLIQCFKALTSDVTEAAQLQRLFDELTPASRSIIGDIVDDWNQQHDLLRRLPSEIIARCFECLRFRDLVTVTHVSRGWRMIALAHPAIWVDIDLSTHFNDKTALLEMALIRAGKLPVVIRNCPEPVYPGTVENILAAHLSHIQQIDVPRRVSTVILTEPAPHLRFLRIQTHYCIREEFLGGQVAQLRVLKLRGVSFPQTCPALSTVTHLTLHLPFGPDQAATCKPLFRLFPALQSLSLMKLEFSDRALVPDGPAPPSLRQLDLDTSEWTFDVCECYENWAPIALHVSEVTINQSTPPTRNLRHLVSGAVELVIGCEDSYPHTCFHIIAVGLGERRHVLSFWGRSDETDDIVRTFHDIRSYLADVRSFDVTSAPLVGLLAILPALPNLKHLTFTREFEESQQSEHENALSMISSLPEHCPGLQSIVIRVRRHGRPPMYAASALLAELGALAHVALPDIIVRGITLDDVRCMQLPQFDGFRVVFETEAR